MPRRPAPVGRPRTAGPRRAALAGTRPGPARWPPRCASVAAVVPLPVAVTRWLDRRGHRDYAAGRHLAAGLYGDHGAGCLPAPDGPDDAGPQAELAQLLADLAGL